MPEDDHRSTWRDYDEERCLICGVLVAYWDETSHSWVEV